jgi:predicted permease
MPDWPAYVRQRLQLSALRREREAEIVEDLARQLDDAYRDALKSGATEDDARRRAEEHVADWEALAAQLAASPRQRQPAIDRWSQHADDRALERRGRLPLVSALRQDLVYGLRMLRHSPAVTLMAALSLALGIGANTAIFSVMHALIYRPLPVPHPEQLVAISDPASSGMLNGLENGERSIFSYHEFAGMRARNDVLDGLMAFMSEPLIEPVSTRDVADARRTSVKMTSGAYFSTLGVAAARGRTYGLDVESAPMAHPVVVVSDRFWRDRLDADPDITARTVRIRQTVFHVIGVMPPSFSGATVGESPDLWAPLTMQQAIEPGGDWLVQQPGTVRRTMFLHVMGRLKSGVTLEQANSGMNLAFKQSLEEEAASIADSEARRELLDARVTVRDARLGISTLRGEYQTPLTALMALVGLLLLLACANVANLLLARASARQRELAVRVAMGAVRARLIRQLLTESVLLAGLGAVLGLGVAMLGVPVLLRLVSPDNSPVPIDAGLTLVVLVFTAGVAIATGVLFGIAPALRATRTDLQTVFRVTASNVAGAGGRWSLGKLLAGVQVAIALVLLVSAGLFVRTLQNLSTVPLGYDPAPILLFEVRPAASGFAPAAVPAFFEALLPKLAAIPGVRAASLSDHGIFLDNDSGLNVSFNGYTPPSGTEMAARFDRLGPGFFRTLGIPIRAGRDIAPEDATAIPPCWLNETMTRHFFGDQSPIGRRMTLHYSSGDADCDIAGIVADVRTHTLSAPMERRFYMPYFGGHRSMASGVFTLRTSGDPLAVASDVRRILRESAPSLEPPDFHTVGDLIARRLVQKRMTARLSTVFGALSLLLASVGLYGVLAYAVTRRTTEIGVRMALGAPRARILGNVLKEALIVTVAGAIAGVGGALLTARLMGTMLFGLSPRDPATLAVALGALFSVALFAAVVPAWRASRTDPLRALRETV